LQENEQTQELAMATLAINSAALAGPRFRSLEISHETSDDSLLSAARNGHRPAFGELCRRYENRIFRVAHRITRNREDAEDAVQDSFLNAFIHLKDFDGRSGFLTWLTRIAINSALGKLRKKRSIREVPIEEPGSESPFKQQFEVPDHTPNPEESYRDHEQKKLIRIAIHGLRPRARKVVEFHQLREYSIKETAKLLGISTSAAKSRMFHARAALRKTRILRIVTRTADTGAARIAAREL
jgi:RNA polymerase sigma factor (sigma-70 family)